MNKQQFNRLADSEKLNYLKMREKQFRIVLNYLIFIHPELKTTLFDIEDEELERI